MQGSVLTSANVAQVFEECLASSGQGRIVQGVMHSVAFDEVVLDKNHKLITQMLDQLPRNFQEQEGGGHFMSACNDVNGELWTDSHMRIETLLLLGLAIGRIDFCLPRELWHIMPYNLPYFRVKR